ncbi:MAG: hypothetical protein MUE85_13585 [Microscillaceae bacterium]|jgi:hypothetical protein|nr:hypothetical protein [Microscillaceae bacterium]
MTEITEKILSFQNNANQVNKIIYDLQENRVQLTVDLTILNLDFQLDEEYDFTLYEVELDLLSGRISQVSAEVEKYRYLFDTILEQLENLKL